MVNNEIIGLIQGKPNKRKISRTYDRAYEQITQLWKLLPEAVRTTLKSDEPNSNGMEVDATSSKVGLTQNKINNLEEKVNSLKGKRAYEERMAKKKLKKQLQKKIKSKGKQLLKEEMRKRKKELKEKKGAAWKLKNGGIHDSTIEERVNEVTDELENLQASDEDDECERLSQENDSMEMDSPSIKVNRTEQLKKKIEDLTNSTGRDLKLSDDLSNKKLRSILKKELKAKKKNDKKKRLKVIQLEALAAVKEEKVKIEEVPVVSPTQPPKTTEIMYNKIDLPADGKKKFKKEKPKAEKDPVKALIKLEELNKKISELKEMGQEEKAAAIQNKETWKKALLKAEGVKVKDDIKLLKKSIRKKENKKNKSKVEWDKRNDMKEKKMADAQNKRKENISKKKKDKKSKKIKKSIKKGRVVI